MVFDSLAALVPKAGLETSAEVVGEYASDWSSNAILRGLRGALIPPAAVLRPASAEDVARALQWASQEKVPVVTAGGRSGVSGGTVTAGGDLLIDIRALDLVLELDEVSGIVHVQAGVLGTDLEAWLNQRGHTLGHFPQSVALSTVGGWIRGSQRRPALQRLRRHRGLPRRAHRRPARRQPGDVTSGAADGGGAPALSTLPGKRGHHGRRHRGLAPRAPPAGDEGDGFAGLREL